MRRRALTLALALAIAWGPTSVARGAEPEPAAAQADPAATATSTAPSTATAPPPSPAPAATLLPPSAPPPSAMDPQLFPRPPAIEPRIRFWTRIYSEVESNEGLIHDAEDLGVVYDVIRWPRELSSGYADHRYERAKAQYRAILLRLARGERTHLGSEERRVLALFPPGVSSETLRAATNRIRFQRGQADRFRDGLIRSGRWEDHIRVVFAERGLPSELASLPHVESSYNPIAYSHAGAAGLWQFMPSTGRRFLRIDGAVDERFDPYRSSEAAAAFLAENHRMTGAWPLALTAYNHGPGGIMKAVRAVGSRDIGVLIERYRSRSWGFASKNFYSGFLAACDVERDALRHFGPLRRDQPADAETVVTDGYFSVRGLAQAFGVDPGVLRELNLGLREPVWSGRQLVPRGYALRVPRVVGRPPAAQVLASIPPVERRAEQVRSRYHVVRRGDTLSRIARRYGVSERSLARSNGIRNARTLAVGRRLRIPGAVEVAVAAETSARKPPAAKTSAASSSSATHRVRPGETLGAIARRHGVSVSRIADANGIGHAGRIRAGQVLRIPGSGDPAAPTAAPAAAPTAAKSAGSASAVARTHRVRRGETLTSVARRYRLTIAQLADANGLTAASHLRAGQRLTIPARRSASASEPAGDG